MTWMMAASLALVGCGVGFLAGLLGVGGGLIMIPFLIFALEHQEVATDLAIKMAIATAMSTIVFTSISSIRSHHQRGAIGWELVKGFAPGILLGSALSSLWIFAALKGTTLALIFCLFAVFTATQIFLDRKPKPSRQVPGPLGLLLMGAPIGLVSGLVGAGGAFMSVPFMLWCNVPIHRAVATSAALGLPIALANVVGYVISGQQIDAHVPGAVGYLWLPGLVAVASFSVLTAPFGARAAHKLPVKKFKKVFASFLFVLAAQMLFKVVLR